MSFARSANGAIVGLDESAEAGVSELRRNGAPNRSLLKQRRDAQEGARRGHANPERHSHDRRNQLKELNITLHIYL